MIYRTSVASVYNFQLNILQENEAPHSKKENKKKKQENICDFLTRN